MIDGDALTTFVNRRMAEMLGWTVEQMIGRPIFGFMDDEGRAIAEANLERRRRGLSEQHEFKFQHHAGHAVWTRISTSPIEATDGTYSGAIALVSDITEQRRLHVELSESEARFRALVEHSSDIITVLDPDLAWRSSSPAGARLLGYSLGYDPPGGILSLVHPDDVELAATTLQEGADGVRGPDEPVVFRVRRTDGAYLHFETTGQNLIDEPTIGGIVLNSRDVTERLEAHAKLRRQELELERLTAQAAQERLELELERARRLESLGTLAGGVAHDFNNLLGVAKIYLSSLSEALAPDSAQRSDAEQVRYAIDRAAALTRQLLLFGRDDDAPPETFDPDPVIEQVLTFLAPTMGGHIDVAHRRADVPTRVCISRVRLEQVLVNTVLNARDAIEGTGTVTITTDTFVVEDHTDGGLDAGEYVAITIADTGTGMSADVLAAAVEPFFTTKRDEGTGLGLAVVHGIVSKAGGKMSIRSEPGTGTTVTLLIPTP